MTILILGLGNPGAEYKNTRHNVGFIVVEAIAEHYGIAISNSKKFNAYIGDGHIDGRKVFFAMPMTYMNLSGKSALAIKQYLNIANDDIIVMHDELDVEVGNVKYKNGGGARGHNGIRSINNLIGQDYHRIMIGISRPETNMTVHDYVLSKFNHEQLEQVRGTSEYVCKNLNKILNKDFKI